jgi:hypothetical protein
MFPRRLLAGLLVLGLLGTFSVPASAQKGKEGKENGKKKEDKDKDKDKDTEKKKDETKDADKVNLKWKFEKDKTFYQKMTTTTKQTMKVMNNDVSQTQEQTFYFSWTPIEEKDGKWTIRQKIEGVSMNIDIGGSKISYDSTKENTANNPLGDFFKALVGSEFRVVLDPKTLKVSKIEGREEFLKKLIAANPQMKALLETILSENALKEMAEPTFAVVPGRAVSKGYKWEKTNKLDMGPIGQYDNTYDYTFEGAGDSKGLYKIKVDTKLKYKAPDETKSGQGGLPFKIKGADLSSKNASGQIIFDNNKGRVEKSSMKLSLSGKLSIEIGGQTTDVTLSQTQESNVETTDTNPVPKKSQ